jgi:transcription elongation factor GreA
MPDTAITKKFQEMLNEEKWTRATLSNYTVAHLKELDALLAEASKEHLTGELKELSDEHLGHSKNSIIALYVSGVLDLSLQSLNDGHMMSLISIFVDNKKWNVVRFLAERILEFGENKEALRILADCHQNENDEDAVYAVWERLVKVDYEEAEIVKLIAERYERAGDLETALDYYKKALHRFIGKRAYLNVKELWAKLVQSCPDDIDFFLHVNRKIAKQISVEKAAGLLQELYGVFKQRENWDTALEILKLIMESDEKDAWVRKEIVDCFSGKYASHSHLDEYIKLSNLNQSYRSLPEAIADFEKHIAFDRGNFVCHRTWGIGRISEIKGDEIVIDFAKTRGHKMSLKMAVNALSTLSKDHIWVLKSIWKKEKLHDKVKNEIAWTLKTIIRSFDNRADLKKIKAELVPSVLSASEWNSWSAQAKEILKSDPSFGNASDDIDVYVVRDRPLSLEEKIYAQFKAEKAFYPRLQCIRSFIEAAEPDSEYFNEMYAWLTAYLKPGVQANDQVISAYLTVRQLSASFSYLNFAMPFSFAELFEGAENPEAIYEAIKDADLKRSYLQSIKNLVPEWPSIYCKLIPIALSTSLVDALVAAGEEARLKQTFLTIVEKYRDFREAFVWAYKSVIEYPFFKSLGIPYEKLLINLIHLLDITFKEIANHREGTLNRKINKQVQAILFKEEAIAKYLENADRNVITRIYTLLTDVRDLDPAIRLSLRKSIIARFPDFKFLGEEERSVVSRGLIVTAKKYEEKQRQLQHIMEVEVPQNSKEIAYALSLGDLRENAEYKAAKEKQEILNNAVAKLKHEIERAQIFDPSTASDQKVGFGTTVTLRNNLSGKDETYTILGPWESDPENNIISYLSPLGSALFLKKAGDTLKFAINEQNYDYLIQGIKVASLS